MGDVFEGARALPPDRRPVYLAEKCGSDEALRQEVTSLLAWDDARAASFLETPALVRVDGAIVMKNLEGQRIGPYQLASKIGAGGMGEVYKAHDTRLDCAVAIKVLTAHLADDPHARERFQREARAVAALNHPHICTLHDVGSQDPSTGSGQAIDFLVMEYLDGETLAERLAKGPLPLDRALQDATEIAGALDKAHRQGITHRDLKPGNVMLTTVGTKLLDFGLAKLRPAVGGVVRMSAAAHAGPSLTGRGTILGTLQYMAPEQLEGKPADARTDIFAFGALLYEMLTGKRAFEGTSQASLISAILSSDPPPIAVAATSQSARIGSRRQEVPGERPRRALAERKRSDERAGVDRGERPADGRGSVRCERAGSIACEVARVRVDCGRRVSSDDACPGRSAVSPPRAGRHARLSQHVCAAG